MRNFKCLLFGMLPLMLVLVGCFHAVEVDDVASDDSADTASNITDIRDSVPGGADTNDTMPG